MIPQHIKPYGSVLDTIGWTPLVRLHRVGAGIRTPVYGKAEYANPGGSVKDRIGLAIIEDAERRGDLQPGGVIVEGTSGNTGVGLALAAALKGYRCIFTMPDKMSQEKVRLLRAYGAEVVITPTAVPPDHPDNYVMRAKLIVEETPGAVLANQFYNAINPEAHYATTGPEIWTQTEGKITHFVAGAGTGGTVSGAGKYLKEQNPAIRVIAGDPVGSLYAGYAEHLTGTSVSGRGSAAALLNLLRRSIPRRNILSVCFKEWSRSGRIARPSQEATRNDIERIISAERARPSKKQDPVAAYRSISQMLSERKHQHGT